MAYKIKAFIIILILKLSIVGCGNQAYKKGNDYLKKQDYKLAIVHLKRAEFEHPSNWKFKRDLGIAYFKSHQIKLAIEKLVQAYQIRPNEKRTLLYLGLSYESAKMYSKAISVYSYYLTLKLKEPLRGEISARRRDNYHNKLLLEVKTSLDNLDKGHANPISPNSLAVLYFRNISQWNELNPIVKGIAEVIINDLSKIKFLRIVEREKLQILLDELQLSPADLFDKIKASDVGKMLDATKLISGGIERISDTQVRINAGVVDTKSGFLRGKGTQAEGGVSEILALAKQLVFDLINDIGIQLNEQESDAIKLLATKSSLAFIAFCKGVNFEDQKKFSLARTQYSKAIKLDAGFILAKQKLQQLPGERLTIPDMEMLVSKIELIKRANKRV